MRIIVRAAAVGAALLGAAGLALGGASPASAAGITYPVNYSFASGFVAGFLEPNTPPAGANDWSCKPSAAHPYPVVLVHGTFENENDDWGAASPLLADNGYCVFAFDYGGATAASAIQGTGEIAASAAQLETFVHQVLAATGASKVDLVGHSQGGMMPRYYIKNLGGASTVNTLVALAPSNNGTTLDGITELGDALGILEPANDFLSLSCEACVEQEAGSPFLTALNSGAETLPGVNYTVIETKYDEVVTPYTNAFLPAASNVTNILLQNQCGLDASDHLEIAYDPIAMVDMLNALDPAHPQPVPCEVVLPVA
ncbi:alpha/beta fold hydrolase [Actinospica sp. MGRD01-02]|uniref:Alpha/beta fold hydrolase n=1 Tax=Actinospica acidithermotolerans TaxID=2828514 RepID=A0A941E5I7_9ACTN|nr:alpha/beta fold hydrolase [Actinospica acidithermotolerans]MBR7826715.1 alpha/beta fold hydrolase [Actinospica acidithermotolerans]